MELRIGINNRRKQFAGIGRDHLCDFQDGVSFPEEGGVIYNQFAQGYEDNVSNVRVQISMPQSKGLTIYGVRLGQKK